MTKNFENASKMGLKKKMFYLQPPTEVIMFTFPGSKYQSVLPKRLISQQGYLRCPQLVQGASARLITATKRWEHTAPVHGFLLVLEHILKFYYPL